MNAYKHIQPDVSNYTHNTENMTCKVKKTKPLYIDPIKIMYMELKRNTLIYKIEILKIL